MHNIYYLSYHCSVSKHKIMNDIKERVKWEGDYPYHGQLAFHDDIICKDEDEARKTIKTLDRGFYDDHAVFYKDGRKKYWLVKIEFHS